MTDDSVIGAGAWCAPVEVLHLADYPNPPIPFPKVSAERGAFTYPQPGSPEWDRLHTDRAASDAMMALIHRAVGDMARAQDDVIEYAYLVALGGGWDVHVHRRPYLHAAGPHAARFVGISLEPRPSERGISMVYEHTHDATYDHLDYDPEDDD